MIRPPTLQVVAHMTVRQVFKTLENMIGWIHGHLTSQQVPVHMVDVDEHAKYRVVIL